MNDWKAEWREWRPTELGFRERWTAEALEPFDTPPDRYQIIRQEWSADATERVILEAR